MRMSLAAWMVILTASFAFSATPETDREGDGTVPLYTNADLARLGAPAAAPEPLPDSGQKAETRQEDWDMVQRFLDREYARIDAERASERENRMLERSRDSGGSEKGVWSYPGIWPDFYAGYGSFGPRPCPPDPGYRVLPNSLGSRIIQGGHGRYSRMQGSDAFPGAARPPAGHSQPHRHGRR